MKYLILSIIMFCCSLLLDGQQSSQKKALLIGVGKYPTEGGWGSLSSANDLKLIKEALLKQGFIPENIRFLTDEQATRQNILQELKTKTIKEVQEGDMFYLHFSGHGQQKQDTDGDEIDGYDECLVPYDSPKKYQQGVNEGEKLITDDELNKMLTDLRKKLGNAGHLFVSLDACHSGTGTRSAAVGRGSAEPMASPDFISSNGKNKLNKEFNQINDHKPGSPTPSVLAPMIAFFGSAQNQINYEMTNDQGEQFGSLSYALSKYLVLTKKDESYRALFDKIKVEMSSIAPLQVPQVEGDLDIEVFNGKALGAARYFNVISEADDENILINGGFLQGLNIGSVMGFYPSDTRDLQNSKPIVAGKIAKSNLTSSFVVLDSLIAPELIKNSWVYVMETSMGEIKVAISIKVSDTELLEKIRSKLFSYSFIIDNPEEASLFIEEGKTSFGIPYVYLKTLNGYTLDSFATRSIQNSTLIKFRKKILEYLKGYTLRKMVLESEDYYLSFQIIPIENSMREGKDGDIVPIKADASGNKILKVGSMFRVLIKNEGNRPAYFNMIDLQPDNMYNFLFPAHDRTADEMKILPGQQKLMPNVFEVGEPLGNELFKLIASSKPIDLRSAYGTRGNTSKNPFEKIFSEMETPEFYNTRGSRPIPTGNVDINIYSESFIIVK